MTTPRQRRRLGALSPEAMGSEGPLARALDIVFGTAALGVGLAVVVLLGLWVGWPLALGALVVLAVLGAVFVA